MEYVTICCIDLYVTIETWNINMNIPSKNLILGQNDRYVKSKQVIVEIRTGTSTFHFKDKV